MKYNNRGQDANQSNTTTFDKGVFKKAAARGASGVQRIARKRPTAVYDQTVQDVRGAPDDPPIEPGDTRQSTAGVSERLQENAGPGGEIGAAYEPTRLVLDREYTDFVLHKIKQTKQDMRLTVYNWGNYVGDPGSPMSRITREILMFAQRGGRVKILTTDRECYERLKDFNVKIKIPKDVKTMHTKAIVFDDTGLLLGSHNLTNAAMQSNKEASIYTTEFECVAGFTQYFNTLWTNYAAR